MGDSFTTEAFTLLGVGVAVIALRVVARATAVGFKHFQFDDYLMCAAAVRISGSLALVFANPAEGHILSRDSNSIHRWRLVVWTRE